MRSSLDRALSLKTRVTASIEVAPLVKSATVVEASQLLVHEAATSEQEPHIEDADDVVTVVPVEHDPVE